MTRIGPESSDPEPHWINCVLIVVDAEGRAVIVASTTGAVEWTGRDGQRSVLPVASPAEVFPISSQDDVDLAQQVFERQQALQALSVHIAAARREDRVSGELLPLIAMLAEIPDGLRAIEAAQFQEDVLQSILKEFRLAAQRLEEGLQAMSPETRERVARSEWMALHDRFAKQLSSTLLPHQVRELANWSPEKVGIIRLLTDTPVGSTLGLTGDQQSQLRKGTDEAIERLKLEVERARQSIWSNYQNVLTAEQKESITRHLRDLAKRQVMESTPSQLIALMDYPDSQREQRHENQ